MKQFIERLFKPEEVVEEVQPGTDNSELSSLLSHALKHSGHKPILMVMSDDRNCREIGIVTHTQYHLQSVLGFDNTPHILTASGQNSLTTLTKNVLWHLQSNAHRYSAIVTLDTWVTHAVHSIIKDNTKSAPLVFVGLHRSLTDTVVGSDGLPMGNATGIQTVQPDYSDQMAVLRDLRPTGTRIIMPTVNMMDKNVDLSDALHQERILFGGACSRSDFTLNALQLQPQDNVVEKLKEANALPGNVVCLSTDSPILSQSEEIVEFCNQNKITTYALDLTVVARGAAIGSGSSGYVYARRLVPILYQLIADKKRAREIPVITMVENTECRFNELVLERQGVEPTMRDWRMMRMRSIFAQDED